MSECAEQECTHSSHTATSVGPSFASQLETILKQEKGKVPMGIGSKMYLDKLFGVFKEDLSNIFGEYTREISRVSDGFRTSTLEQMNEALQKLDKKYSAMYGQLINKFLVIQEQKVFAAELAVQTLIEAIAEKFHGLDMAGKTADDATYVALKDYSETFENKVKDRMEALAVELKTAAAERMQKKAAGETNEVAKENVQPETKAEATAEQPAPQDSN